MKLYYRPTYVLPVCSWKYLTCYTVPSVEMSGRGCAVGDWPVKSLWMPDVLVLRWMWRRSTLDGLRDDLALSAMSVSVSEARSASLPSSVCLPVLTTSTDFLPSVWRHNRCTTEHISSATHAFLRDSPWRQLAVCRCKSFSVWKYWVTLAFFNSSVFVFFLFQNSN